MSVILSKLFGKYKTTNDFLSLSKYDKSGKIVDFLRYCYYFVFAFLRNGDLEMHEISLRLFVFILER